MRKEGRFIERRPLNQSKKKAAPKSEHRPLKKGAVLVTISPHFKLSPKNLSESEHYD